MSAKQQPPIQEGTPAFKELVRGMKIIAHRNVLDPNCQSSPAYMQGHYQAGRGTRSEANWGGKSNQGLFLSECPLFFLFRHVL